MSKADLLRRKEKFQALTAYERMQRILDWSEFQGESLMMDLPSIKSIEELYYKVVILGDEDTIEAWAESQPKQYDTFIKHHNLPWAESAEVLAA